jgi:putative oxidoreductase
LASYQGKEVALGIIERLLGTDRNYAALISRVMLGIAMVPHGAQKALGWFGGKGFEGTFAGFTEGMGIPVILALLAIAAEFLGSLGLIVGLLGRVAALGIMTNMLVASLWVHPPEDLFNWSGRNPIEGIEFHMLAIALAASILIQGSGAFSIDRWMAGRLKK